MLLTSAIPELGFVRISVQRTGGNVTVGGRSRPRHVSPWAHVIHFCLTIDLQKDFPEWCSSASRTTDAHLLQLADVHGARLATLDTGHPRRIDSSCIESGKIEAF